MNRSTVEDRRGIAMREERMSPCILCGRADYRILRLWPTQPLTRCKQCGLVTVMAKPPVTAIREYYRSAYGEDWLSRGTDARRRALFDRLLREILRRRTPGSLLDVGCGSGQFLHPAIERGWEATGVEISPLACRRAKAELGLDLVPGELADAGFPDATFDVVTFIDVLNHLADPLGQLREAHRVLKAGGLVVVRVPNFRFQCALRRLSLAFGRVLGKSEASDVAVFHLYNFSDRTLKRLLEKAGFVHVEAQPSGIVAADLYRIFSRRWTPFVQGAMALVFLTVHIGFHLSGKKWLWGPSIEAYAERG